MQVLEPMAAKARLVQLPQQAEQVAAERPAAVQGQGPVAVMAAAHPVNPVQQQQQIQAQAAAAEITAETAAQAVQVS